MAPLTFTKLEAPQQSGGVLVEPSPINIRRAIEANRRLFESWNFTIADKTLRDVRHEVRQRVAGLDEATPSVVTGHQPEFIHAGVWAKHVVAVRLAEAVQGSAINLIVDTDTPKDTRLLLPGYVDDTFGIQSVALGKIRSHIPYQWTPSLDQDEMEGFEAALKAVGRERFEASMMGMYCQALRQADPAAGWVDQTVFARQSVERGFGIDMEERCLSQCWLCPLLVEMLASAPRFFECYNSALSDYRSQLGLRGTTRPVPNLITMEGRLELPLWVVHGHDRRHRLFVEPVGDRLRIFADQEQVGEVKKSALACWDTAQASLCDLEDVQFWPRALTLTLWARMLLADLFVHGIGGAKYDRITDLLIHKYFGVQPPAMACVSATLRFEETTIADARHEMRELQHKVRDLRYNPQRHLQSDGATESILKAKADAVAESLRMRQEAPKDRRRRRIVFDEIRARNSQLVSTQPTAAQQLIDQLAQASERSNLSEVASRRDYFFALFDRATLQVLCDSLPAATDFRL